VSIVGLYLPPLFNVQLLPHPDPAQTIISLPVQTALCAARAAGAFVVLVAFQVSVIGLYLPPDPPPGLGAVSPPQTIISLPVHTAV
jgi:hypothetical protein